MRPIVHASNWQAQWNVNEKIKDEREKTQVKPCGETNVHNDHRICFFFLLLRNLFTCSHISLSLLLRSWLEACAMLKTTQRERERAMRKQPRASIKQKGELWSSCSKSRKRKRRMERRRRHDDVTVRGAAVKRRTTAAAKWLAQKRQSRGREKERKKERQVFVPTKITHTRRRRRKGAKQIRGHENTYSWDTFFFLLLHSNLSLATIDSSLLLLPLLGLTVLRQGIECEHKKRQGWRGRAQAGNFDTLTWDLWARAAWQASHVIMY